MPQKKGVKNIIFGLLNVLVSTLQSLWLLSYVQGIMGTEAYGYIAVVTSFVNMANIFTLAFTTFTSRYVTIELHRGDDERANGYFNSSLFSLAGISAFCLVIFTVLSLNAESIMQVSGTYLQQVQVLILLAGGSFTINTLITPFKASLYYTDKVYLMHLLQIGVYLSRVVATITLYSFSKPLVWYAYAGSFVFDLMAAVAYVIISRRLMPKVRVCLRAFRKTMMMEILSSGIWVSINKAGATLLTAMNTYLISIMVSVYMTGIYSTVSQFTSFLGMMTMAMISTMVPTMYKLYSSGEREIIEEYLKKRVRFLAVLLGLFAGGFLIFERYLLNLMIGEAYLDFAGMIALTLITVPLTYPANIIEQMLITYDRYKPVALSQLITGTTNVILIYHISIFVEGSIYVMLCITLVLSFIKDFIFLPLYYAKISNYSIHKYYRELAKGVATMLICAVVSFVLVKIKEPFSWGKLIFEVAGAGSISLIFAYATFLDKSDREVVFSFLGRKNH